MLRVVFGFDHALAESISCDKPLALFLLVSVVSFTILFSLHCFLSFWVSYPNKDGSRVASGRFLHLESHEFQFRKGYLGLAAFLVLVGFLLAVFLSCWLVLGNIWIFSGSTCRETSRDNSTAHVFPFSLYVVSLISVIYFNALLLFLNSVAVMSFLMRPLDGAFFLLPQLVRSQPIYTLWGSMILVATVIMAPVRPSWTYRDRHREYPSI